MKSLANYQEAFLAYLNQQDYTLEPKGLYAPIDYILKLGGKRLRPILVLLAAESFGATKEKALPASLAVEVFHNFSLVHDDIMDEAPLRRGKPTVHKKWDTNTGILSGDAMLIMAYQQLHDYPSSQAKALHQLFSKTAIQICEGQQYDVEFETRNLVSETEYLQMIEYKTAVLVACALQMGAIIAEASEESQHKIYEFGKLLGIAFQLQDDFLDAFGNPATFGKQIGGDILENKKTFLYIKAKELGNEKQKDELNRFFSVETHKNEDKIQQVKDIFEATGAKRSIQKAIEVYTHQAIKVLNSIEMKEQAKNHLLEFSDWLMTRKV